MKKLIALLLAAVMVMSMFAACADTGSNQTDPPKTTSGNNDTTTTPKGDTTTTPVEPGEVSTDWIIEDDTSIEGHVVFAIPFKGSQGMDAMIAESTRSIPTSKSNCMFTPTTPTARPLCVLLFWAARSMSGPLSA